MFEKIKAKAKQGKEWAINHKTEIIGVSSFLVGSFVTEALCVHRNNKIREEFNKEYPNEIKVLSQWKRADGRYWATGDSELTVKGLSDDMIAVGMPSDAKVIGTVVYVKRK